MIRVMIADDHKILTEGLSKLINESGLAVVSAVAYNARECRSLLAFGLPDVLLLDINLPDADGTELCKELKTIYPQLKILALTSYDEYTIIRQMLENGASGYILKSVMSEEMLEGIEAVAAGEIFLCREVDRLMKSQTESTVWLTNRERELLKLVVEGYTNPEIARKIFLSPETVKGYRKNLLLKLGAKNTAALVKIALEQKLI